MIRLSNLTIPLAVMMAFADVAWSTPQLSLSQAGATLGRSVEVELRLSAATEPISGFNAKLWLPPGITLSRVAKGELLPASFVVESNTFVEGSANAVTLLAYSIADTAGPQDGVLLRLTLDVTNDPVGVGLGNQAFVEKTLAFKKSGIAALDGETSQAHTTADGILSISADGVPRLAVDPSSLTFGSAGAEHPIQVSNVGFGTGMAWTATVVSGNDWLSVVSGQSGTDGGTVTARAFLNGVSQPRQGTIKIDAGAVPGSPVMVQVTQDGDNTPSLVVSPLQLTVPAPSGLSDISISNGGNGTLSWTARVVQGLDWLRIESASNGTSNGTITISHMTNATTGPRTGLISISAPGALSGQAVVVVTQSAPAVVTVQPTVRTVTSAAGTVEFAVANSGSASFDWSAAVVAGVEWLTIASGDQGQGEGSIILNVLANASAGSRSGTLRVTAPGVIGSPVDVSVVQAGNQTPLLSVQPLERTIGNRGGESEFIVSNAGNGALTWSAALQGNVDWLSIVSGAGGVGPGTLRISALPNASPDERTAEISIEAPGADNAPLVLTVRQRGAEALTITSPNGGERLDRNTPFPITWTSGVAKEVSSVAIHLWRGGNIERTIVSTAKNSGEHQWIVPAGLLPGDDFQIQIVDVSEPGTHDESDGFFAIACPPDAPEEFSASDDAPGRVRLSWLPVDGATTYDLYRSSTQDFATAEFRGTTSSFVYDDTTAEAPVPGKGLACRRLNPVKYWYWVVGVNDCDAGEPSEPEQGYRGKDAEPDGYVFAKVLPFEPVTADTLGTSPAGKLALRLRHEDGVDPGSVWGTVTWGDQKATTNTWLAIDDQDGWVVYEPTVAWQAGEVLTYTVGGSTLKGETIEEASASFTVVAAGNLPSEKHGRLIWQPDASGASTKDTAGTLLSLLELDDSMLLPDLPGGVGGVYAIGPNTPYEEAQRIWLPLPDGSESANLNLFYLHLDDEFGPSWSPSDVVEGWLVPDSRSELEVNGIRYVGFLVRHAAIVRLGTPQAAVATTTSASVVGDTFGDLLPFVALTLIAMALRWRRRSRRERPNDV